MKCPECQSENREGAKFCIKCGEKFEVKCPNCGNSLPSEALFCEECGQKLDETVETGVKSPTIDREAFNMTTLYILIGPNRGESFELGNDTIYVGRSPDNDIQIKDASVSRKHLKIIERAEKYFVIDLKSKNGTFVEGNQVRPGIEFEVKEGVPIIIGMGVICLGEGCLEYAKPFLDLIDLSTELNENDRVPAQDRTMTVQKNMEFIYKINNILSKSLDLDDILTGILDCVLDLFRRIDRAVIILIDESGKISKLKTKLRNPQSYTFKTISKDVVKQVIRYKKAVSVLDPHDAEEANLSDTLKLSKIGSTMCVPLICHSQIMGVIYVDSLEKPYGFRKKDISLLTDLSNRAAIAIENAMLYENLEEKM